MRDNFVAKLLFIIGVAQITIGIFVGILFAVEGTGYGNQFRWALFFAWSIGGFMVGMLFIGFAENIQLLQRIYLKMNGNEMVEPEPVDDKPSDPNEWYLPSEDRERIEHYYKNETILEIVPSEVEGYCIVKLEYGTNEYVRVVDIHGFGVQEIHDEETKSAIIGWYNNKS